MEINAFMFRMRSHAKRVISDFVFRLRIRGNFYHIASGEIIFLTVQIGWTLDFDSPIGLGRILDSDFLLAGSTHHCVEFNFLDVFFGLLNAFSDQVDKDRIAFFDMAFHFHKSNIIVDHIWMEGNIKLKIIVRGKETLIWGDGEELGTESGFPIKMTANISEIGQLDSAGEFTVDDDCAETNRVFNEFKLHPMRSTLDGQQFTHFLIFHYLEIDILFKFVKTNLGFESNFDVLLLSRSDNHFRKRIQVNSKFG